MTPKVSIDQAKLEALFAPFDSTSEPGLAVGVAHQGRPVFRRGYGLANVELPVALTPAIRMRIGSTSKHFCCLAIMLLAEAGKLSPDDSPRTHLPELPAWAEAMTLAQLMGHVSGLRCSVDLLFESGDVGAPFSTADQLQLLFGLDSVNFAPGESWSYCNGGYVLLTEIVHRVSGRPFAEFLAERILAPVGMSDTLLRPLDTDLVPRSAALHMPDGKGGFRRGVFGPAIGGEGGMVSTVDDMLRWLAHMQSPRIGAAASWERMKASLTLNNGHATGYGLGLFRERFRGVNLVHHAGGVIGGASQMLKAPDLDLDVIIMTNRAGRIDPTALAKGVVEVCVRGLEPAEKEGPAGPPIEGTFFSPESGMALRLAIDKGRPVLDLFTMKAPLRRLADGALALKASSVDCEIRPADSGGALEVTQWGRRERYERVLPPGRDGLAAVAGAWRSPAARIEARIEAGSEGGGTLRFTGPAGSRGYRLAALGPGLWSATTGDPLSPLGGVIEARGEGLAFTSARTHRLMFAR